MLVKKLGTPLDLGKEIGFGSETMTDAGSLTYELSLDAEAVLISLFVSTTAGDVDVNVLTEGATGHDVSVITFPTVSAPTTDLLLRKSASAMRKIRVVVSYTGASTFEIRARGVSAGASSFKILGNNDLVMSQIDVSTSVLSLVGTSLVDRASVAIKNYNTSGVLYLGGTAAEATTSNGWPVGPQESYVVDIAAGQEIFGVADTGTIDVRLSETGG